MHEENSSSTDCWSMWCTSGSSCYLLQRVSGAGGNDDRSILNKLYDEFKKSERIAVIQDCNCMQLKGYIAKCRFFVGARTHATIAAYSTEVPTLVVGYSIKSRGIAKDIFGSEENYVIPIEQIKEENKLTQAFIWLQGNENHIKEHLKKRMPQYIKDAENVKEKIKEFF